MPKITEIKNVKLPTPDELKDTTEEETVYIETSVDYKGNEALRLVQDKALEENNKLKIENLNLEKLAQHRIRYSWAIFGFVVVVVVGVLTIFILSGLKILALSSDNLDTLLQANTVQSIGILYIVTKWLYPRK